MRRVACRHIVVLMPLINLLPVAPALARDRQPATVTRIVDESDRPVPVGNLSASPKRPPVIRGAYWSPGLSAVLAREHAPR
jgi:hypothetical protein